MDSIFMEIVKSSPVLGLMLIIWYFQRKDGEKRDNDYKEFVGQVQTDSKDRETRLQEIICKLTDKFNIVEDVKKDVEEIKEYIRQ